MSISPLWALSVEAPAMSPSLRKASKATSDLPGHEVQGQLGGSVAAQLAVALAGDVGAAGAGVAAGPADHGEDVVGVGVGCGGAGPDDRALGQHDRVQLEAAGPSGADLAGGPEMEDRGVELAHLVAIGCGVQVARGHQPVAPGREHAGALRRPVAVPPATVERQV